jgi:hypothetical protein
MELSTTFLKCVVWLLNCSSLILAYSIIIIIRIIKYILSSLIRTQTLNASIITAVVTTIIIDANIVLIIANGKSRLIR